MRWRREYVIEIVKWTTKVIEIGENFASKDRSDVFELMLRNLPQFTRAKIQTYHPAVRKVCLDAFKEAQRAERRRPRE